MTSRWLEMCNECFRVTGNGSGERYWREMDGWLTLRGTTRPLLVPLRVTANGNSLRASGEFSVRQSEFGRRR